MIINNNLIVFVAEKKYLVGLTNELFLSWNIY